jgi:hypothetical protein
MQVVLNVPRPSGLGLVVTRDGGVPRLSHAYPGTGR